MTEALAVVLLLGVLAVAVTRPRGLPEVAAAAPAAVLLVATGALPWARAEDELRTLGPTVGFLAAVLLLAELCDRAGVFRSAGDLLVRVSAGRPRVLLRAVLAVATATTVLLSLDATVVLLTPVVFAATASQRLRPRPHVYACAHLANSGSLLLPVSNLTNLLAFAASGLSFGRFALLMLAPQAAAVAVEHLVLSRHFAADLAAPPTKPRRGPSGDAPVYALAVLALTLLGFVVTSALGASPAWAAAAGALLLAVRVRPSGRTVLAAVNPGFLGFVLCLGLVVRGVTEHGAGRLVAAVVPDGASLPALLLVGLVAAVLANLVNNLPAVLLLLPAVAGAGPGPVLAALIGVNVGPNLTYVGSLATLLWRRVLHDRDVDVALGEYTRLGLVSVPAVLVAAVTALWLSLAVLGGGT